MQPLQRATKTSGIIDRIGLRLLILALCFTWFYLLWGKPVQAICAAVGLTLLINQALIQAERRTLKKREKSLRRKLGGQIAVDALVYESAGTAAAQAARWLSGAVPLFDIEEVEGGALGVSDGKKVYVECLRKHAASKASRDDVVALVRAARGQGADIAVLCCACQVPPDAICFADEQVPRARLVSRDLLIRLAGTSAPATDEQLTELGAKSRTKRFDKEMWKARILQHGKARRFGVYGLGLLAMFLVTRQWPYAVPAAICLTLFFFSRIHTTAGPFTL